MFIIYTCLILKSLLSAAVGVKLLGNLFRAYLVGTEESSLFHIPQVSKLNAFLREETGIEDFTEPGVLLDVMIRVAKEIFGSDPLILEHDERKVT